MGGRSISGSSAATREFVVIASAHVYPVYPDWIESLLRPFEDEKVALTYGKQRGYGLSKFSEHQIFHQWYPDVSKPNQETAFCNNANAAIRKSLWEKNPYDETLTGLEDLAWAKWAKEQGYTIAYVAEAEIVHIHNETPKGVYNRYRREAMALRKIYPEANFNFYDFVRLTITNIVSDLWYAAREGMLVEESSLRYSGSVLCSFMARVLGTARRVSLHHNCVRRFIIRVRENPYRKHKET